MVFFSNDLGANIYNKLPKKLIALRLTRTIGTFGNREKNQLARNARTRAFRPLSRKWGGDLDKTSLAIATHHIWGH